MNKERYCNIIIENQLTKKSSWLMNVLVSFDQLGNAIAGGNPDSTISARIGYFMHNQNGNPNWYWNTLEQIVNFTFQPIDGIEHCFVAYCSDKDEYFNEGNIISKLLLAFFVIVFCIPLLIIIIRLVVLFYPKAKNNYSLNDEPISLEELNTFRKEYCK